MNDNPFEIKEEACASSPDHRRYLLIQAVDTETGEIVWAVGDDQYKDGVKFMQVSERLKSGTTMFSSRSFPTRRTHRRASAAGAL